MLAVLTPKRARVAWSLFAFATGSGCSIALDVQPSLGKSAVRKNAPIARVAERATDLPSRVGWGTFTVFAIPIAPVSIEGEGDRQIMQAVGAALTRAGYRTQMEKKPGREPILRCKVEEFSFKNYTWLAPFWTPAWGSVRLALRVEKNGDAEWERVASANGYDSRSLSGAANVALESLITNMAAVFATREFRNSIAGRAAELETVEAPREAMPAPKSPNRSTKAAEQRCSVEQLLTMKNSGLSDAQIRAACE